MKTATFFQTFLLVLLLAVTGSGAMAQETEYHPFADNAVWSVNNIKYATHGDTTICGRDYLKVYRQEEDHPFDFDVEQAEYFCAIRNDTVGKRVYGIYKADVNVWQILCVGNHDYLPAYTTSDTSEFLLFDFSIEAGDTITIASFEGSDIYLYNISTYEGEYNDSVMLLDNTLRKAKKVIVPNGYYYPTWEYSYIEWIEGIGSTNGNFDADANAYFEITEKPSNLLLCFEEEGTLLLSYPEWDNDYNYDCFYLSHSGTIENQVRKGIIYPNPTSGVISIDFIENGESTQKQVSVYAITGKIVYSYIFNSQTFEIDMHDYPSGLYLIEITENSGNVLQAKIIKQ